MATNPGTTKMEENRGAVAFAIFLCGIAVALAVISVAKLGAPAAVPGKELKATEALISYWHPIWLATYVAAIFILFMGLNGRELAASIRKKRASPRPTGSEPSLRERIASGMQQLIDTIGSAGQIFLGILLFGLSVFALFQIVTVTTGAPPPNERFALVFEPAGAAQADGATTSSPTRAPPPAAADQRKSVMFWDVQDQPANPREGLLAMFMAALLVAVFGLFYPQMRLSASSDTASFIQKLVVPLISLGLFGVGVQQQAEAEQLRQDVKLAKQGLPPAMYLPRKERLYVLNGGNIPPATAKILDDALAEKQQQAEEMAGEGAKRDAKVDALIAELQELRNAIKNRPGAKVEIAESPLFAQLATSNEKMKTQIEQNERAIADTRVTTLAVLDASDKKTKLLADAQRAALCRELEMRLEGEELTRASLYTAQRESTTKQTNHILRNAWIGLKGEDTGDLARLRDQDRERARGEVARTRLLVDDVCK